jgi:hypothetical protein
MIKSYTFQVPIRRSDVSPRLQSSMISVQRDTPGSCSSSSIPMKEIQEVIEALLELSLVSRRTSPGSVSRKLVAGVQFNRQNCLMLSRPGDNASESPNAVTKAKHDIQRLRLFTIVPLVRS